ncbi:sugar phosphate isomerase/epimerase family protein [Cohnella sp. GCM10020058]|uniref:sugar phosphate isomerase/epimerase family protein n=1 Tax=Cohnella sp. GCM10020058 TaxID=3317330 RepID=UPI0036333B21
MKLGVSTYSLYQAILRKEMNVLDVVDWTADQGGEHIEIVPVGYNLYEEEGLAEKIAARAAACGIEVSNYAVRGNLVAESEEAFRAELERLKGEVDMAARLGVKRMRHDAATHPDTSAAHYARLLPRLSEGCAEIADYAAGYGIVTSIENHGYLLQAFDRVLGLVHAVGRENFRTTLDVGNFVCTDGDPLASVLASVPYASMVHFKDFYVRPPGRDPGEGWFRSTAGRYLRGAIVGQGDLDLPGIVSLLKRSGYDGYISIEFEGMEDCRDGTRIALANARRLWDEA